MSEFATQSRTVLLHLALAHLRPHEAASAEYAESIQVLHKADLYGAFVRSLPVTRTVLTLAELRQALADPKIELIWVAEPSALRLSDLTRSLSVQALPKKIIYQPCEAHSC